MSDEIVRRLRSRSQESLRFLKDSLPADGEVEEEEEGIEDEELDSEESTSEEDMPEDMPDDEEVDPDEQDSAPEQGPMPSSSSGGGSPSMPSGSSDEDMPEEEDTMEIEDDEQKDHSNPLDNQYAVKFGLGERVAIAYSDGTATDAEATIEGYDGEGFYRIKLASGMIINGLTDIALTSLVKGVKESKCLCGCTKYVNESNSLVCDNCGRPLRENSNLTVLSQDKKKKNIIRAEQHPVSTANRPNISENIRKAFKRSSMSESAVEDLAGDYEVDGKPVHIYRTGDNSYSIHDEYGNHSNHNSDSVKAYIKGWGANRISESSEDDEDLSIFFPLEKSLEGEFWTRLSELVADIEDLGYYVLDSNAEYVVVGAADEDIDAQMQIPVGGTARTITLDFRRAHIV